MWTEIIYKYTCIGLQVCGLKYFATCMMMYEERKNNFHSVVVLGVGHKFCGQIIFSIEILCIFCNGVKYQLPHQTVVWCNNSWLGFLKILNYVPKEREKYTAKNEPSFVAVKCCDGS